VLLFFFFALLSPHLFFIYRRKKITLLPRTERLLSWPARACVRLPSFEYEFDAWFSSAAVCPFRIFLSARWLLFVLTSKFSIDV
jgi:hypothetical protein